MDAWFDSKDPAKQQAAKEYLEQGRSQPAERSAEQQTALKGDVEENVPQEEETQTNPQLDAIYEKIGKKPPEDIPAAEGEENIHETKRRVPIEDVQEKNSATGKYTEPFDPDNSIPREVKWRGQTWAARPHEEEGYVRLGGGISGKGAKRRISALNASDRRTSVPDILENKELNEVQQAALQRGQKENQEGNVRKPQGDAYEKAAK